MKKHIIEIKNKTVNIFICDNADAPVIYANMHSETGDEIIHECNLLGCRPFHLVSITGLDWDAELSPWKCEPVVSKNDNFEGKADLYMNVLVDEIIPRAESIIKDSFKLTMDKSGEVEVSLQNLSNPRRIISGYSMGGLFALYAPYITDVFSDVISVSGSVWFPGFISYIKENDFLRKPGSVYLSVGDKESKTKNQYFCKTLDTDSELCKLFQNDDINSVFELNPGNHFTDVPQRMAKGIAWMLKNC